jgi:hypothetical protein
MKNARSRKLLLVTTSTLFALFLGEAAARWVLPDRYRWISPPRRIYTSSSKITPEGTLPGWGIGFVLSVPDPEIGWVLSPESMAKHADHVVYSIDHGERLTSAQPRSGPLIVVTGDSFTFGYRVRDEDTWPWLLQERLPNYHVVNVAAPGYGTDQALMAAERKAAGSPGGVSTIVLGFPDFDIDRTRCPQSWLSSVWPASKPQFVPNGAGVQYKGQIKFWSLGSVPDYIIDHSFLLSHVANLVADRLVYRIEQHDGGRQLTIALITDFARRFQSRGIRLVVVVLPYLGDQSPPGKADRVVVIRQLRAASVPTLVMDIPRLPDGEILPHKFTIGTHPNRQYNVLLAGQLAQFLTALSTPGTSDANLAH